ncbi:zinc finger protein weckle [Sergentomyia squamirostris]
MEQVLEEQSISALAESIDPDNGGPKKEVLDSRSNGLKKKRGRPRKSNELHQQVKKEFLDHDELSNGEPDFRDTENESHIFIEEALVPKRQTKRRAAMKRDVESDDDDIPLKKLQKVKRIRLRTDNVCEICSKNYSRRYLLNLHIRAVHSNEELPFVCSKCPKRFVTETKLRVHEMIHLPDEEKFKHPCPYCGKKFAEMRQVQTHIRVVHQGDRPFICEQCGKSFATKRGLAEHRVTHSDEYPFHCPHCPKKFKSNPLLKRHVDTHNNTTYTCPHCGISLNTQRTLKMHMLVHSDVKKYKCQHCGNEYKRAKALKEHLILHSGLRPYSCPFCDKTFTNGSNCRSHKKKAHPAELAALEASGEVQRVANVPKLEQLQPK